MTLKSFLHENLNEIASYCASHIKPDHVVRAALMVANGNTKLLQCTKVSVIRAVLEAAHLGLVPGSHLAECYLVPYGDTCQLIIGYRGLIKLARQSGEVKTIEAHPVYANDAFSFCYGLEPRLEHVPCIDGPPGPLKFVYAICVFKDGSRQVEVMTKPQVDGIRARSKAGNSGPWVTDYDEMARKTVVRRLSKYLPLTAEVADAIARDDEVCGLDIVSVQAAEPGESKTQSLAKALTKALPARVEPPVQEPEPPVAAEVPDAPPAEDPPAPEPQYDGPSPVEQVCIAFSEAKSVTLEAATTRLLAFATKLWRKPLAELSPKQVEDLARMVKSNAIPME